MQRLLGLAIFAALIALFPVPISACSAVSCLDYGIEMRGDFVVTVRHEGNRLRGVTVEVVSFVNNAANVKFSRVTAIDGTVHVTNLPVGDYWLNVELLGINAAYHCFHVAQRPSRKAKRSLTYDWGDLAPATRRIAGTLVDSQPGTGESPLLNLIHRQNVPIRGARFRLQNPLNGEAFDTTSTDDGAFEFDGVPIGTYVLHVEGGTSGHEYEGTDKLIKLRSDAKRDTLLLTRREAGGGSCGGTSLDLSLQ